MLPLTFATLAAPDGDIILVAIEEKCIVALLSRVSGNIFRQLIRADQLAHLSVGGQIRSLL